MAEPKNGKEIVSSFISTLDKIEGVEKDVVKILADLYSKNELTEKNIINKIEKI